MNQRPSAMSALAARNPPPPKTGPGPLIVLIVVALIPAIALFALRSWATDQIDDSEPAPTVPSQIVDPPLPPDPLENAMMSLRRVASPISRDVNVERFESDALPFFATINARSCAAISVDGNIIGSQNGNLAVIPASTEKLIVAAVALDLLGADYRYRTTVRASGAAVDGVIDGDLVLVGGGDPLLTSNWYPTSNLERRPVFNETSLDALADEVVAAGVTSVTGAVLGDGSRYDDEFFAPGWGNGVAGLEAGPYDALMVNDTRVLGEDQRGNDPNAAAAREFTRLLRERGIVVAGEGAAGVGAIDEDGAADIASIESVPLPDVLAEMLRNSDNNTAELLVKEIGFAAGNGEEGTRVAGLAAMTERLETWGADMSNVVLADGSGLSLDNRLTCDSLLVVLQRAESEAVIADGLPVAGESGTLSDIFTEHSVAGRLLGKTGTLNNPPFNEDPPATKALAGYLPVAGGSNVEYVLILNGPTISDQSEYRPVWNELVDVLDLYPAGPTPADLGLR